MAVRSGYQLGVYSKRDKNLLALTLTRILCRIYVEDDFYRTETKHLAAYGQSLATFIG